MGLSERHPRWKWRQYLISPFYADHGQMVLQRSGSRSDYLSPIVATHITALSIRDDDRLKIERTLPKLFRQYDEIARKGPKWVRHATR